MNRKTMMKIMFEFKEMHKIDVYTIGFDKYYIHLLHRLLPNI